MWVSTPTGWRCCAAGRRCHRPPLEQAEKLEQLRLLEADVAIACLETDADAFSVDTAAQLEEARRRCGPEVSP